MCLLLSVEGQYHIQIDNVGYSVEEFDTRTMLFHLGHLLLRFIPSYHSWTRLNACAFIL